MLWPRQCLEVRYLIIFQTIWRKNLAERNQHSESYNPFDFFSSSSSPAALASACGSQYDFIPSWSRKPELGHSCRVPANAWRSDFWLLFGEFDAKTLQKGITGSLTIHSIFFLLDATRKISDFFLFSSSSPAALASACGSQYDFIPCVIPQAGAGPFMPWPRQCLEVRYLIIFQKIWRKNLAERNQHSESYNPFDFFSSSSSPAALASACGSQYDFIPSWSRKPELGHSCRVPANAWRSDFWLFFGEFDAKTLQKGINSGSFTIHSIFFLLGRNT